MTRWVVDASVAVKWYVPEVHSLTSARLLEEEHELWAPELLLAELGNILWKKQRRGELSAEELRDVLAAFAQAPVRFEPMGPILAAACEIALALGSTVYHSLYLAQAEVCGCRLVTADRKLADQIGGTPLHDRLCWIADLP